MPANQIQYSEKYYDNVYEYRRALTSPFALLLHIYCWKATMAHLLLHMCARSDTMLQFLSSHGVTTDKYPDVCNPCFAPRRHVVLPQDIAKLLPKGVLLSEVGPHRFELRALHQPGVPLCQLT